MNGQSVAGADALAATPIEPARTIKVEFGRGMGTLVSAPAPKEKPEPEQKFLLPPWFFFAADILLLAYTVALTFDQPFDLGTILFCAASVTLGAILSVIGVLCA
jgi:hypothetical protein